MSKTHITSTWIALVAILSTLIQTGVGKSELDTYLEEKKIDKKAHQIKLDKLLREGDCQWSNYRNFKEILTEKEYRLLMIILGLYKWNPPKMGYYSLSI